MASTYSDLKFELIGTGEQSGTWGVTTNTNIGTAIEEAITGSADVTFASGNVTLTLTDSNATQAARNLRLNCTGTTGGDRDLIVPNIEKFYLVNNGCNDVITIKNSTGTGVAVPSGKAALVFNDATNVVDAVSSMSSLTLSGALSGTSATFSGDLTIDTDTLYVDSTNNRVGVGTTTPATELDVDGDVTITGTNRRIFVDDTVAIQSSTTDANTSLYISPNGTGTTTSFRIANSSDIANNSQLALVTTDTVTRINSAIAGTGTYLPMLFWTSGSEKMRIDTSGNVGIGTSSPDSRLHISASTNALRTITLEDSASGAKSEITGTASGSLPSLAFKTVGTERMRIDSNGDVGIGTDSPSTYGGRLNVTEGAVGGETTLVVANNNANQFIRLGINSSEAQIAYDDGDALVFGVATDSTTSGLTSEYMRIDSSGNVGIGVAPISYRLRVRGDGIAGTYALVVENSAGQDNFAVRNDGRIYTGTDGESPYNLTTGSAANMLVNSAGLLFRSTSSIKYKTDVQDATHGLDDVMKLRAVTYKGKSENDGDTVFGGLIAEEVHDAGLTEFVQYDDDGNPDALAYGHMVSLAFKAIQELKAELDAVKSELNTLKGN